jgi:hypothetical protein
LTGPGWGTNKNAGLFSLRRTRHEPCWVAKTSSGAGLGGARRWWWSAFGGPLEAKPPSSALSLLGRLLWVGPSPTVFICVFGRWAGETFLGIFAEFCCRNLELLGWPRPAGGHPLFCTADPLMGALHSSIHPAWLERFKELLYLAVCFRRRYNVTLPYTVPTTLSLSTRSHALAFLEKNWRMSDDDDEVSDK